MITEKKRKKKVTGCQQTWEHCWSPWKEANLCRPRRHEGPDPLQVHLDGFCICDRLGLTQLKNHLQQIVWPQSKPNWQGSTCKRYSPSADKMEMWNNSFQPRQTAPDRWGFSCLKTLDLFFSSPFMSVRDPSAECFWILWGCLAVRHCLCFVPYFSRHWAVVF